MIYDRGTMIFRPDVYLSQVFSSCIWNLLVRYRKIGKWSEIARHSPQKLFPERICMDMYGYVRSSYCNLWIQQGSWIRGAAIPVTVTAIVITAIDPIVS